jgi:uncharacterized membrane protein YfcA
VLEPLAGEAAKWLFALGVIGVGFLAVPVMTSGAAYDVVRASASTRASMTILKTTASSMPSSQS